MINCQLIITPEREGCVTVSVCSLCGPRNSSWNETISDLYWQYPFAQAIWDWLSFIINIDLSEFASVFYILYIFNRTWSSQIKVALLAAIIHTFWFVWCCCNYSKFDNQNFHWKSAINMIVASTSMVGKYFNGHMSSSIWDLFILKLLCVLGHIKKASCIIQVDRIAPPYSWISVMQKELLNSLLVMQKEVTCSEIKVKRILIVLPLITESQILMRT